MSLSDLLEADLRTLANEGKKKTGDLKEIAEKTISLLRQSEIIPIDNIFQVLNSAKSINNIKICNLALSILQKLLISKGIESLIPALLFLQSILEEYPDEGIQLKVLQTLMLIHDPSTVRIFPDFINIVWNIYFISQNSKISLVRNTASATLRQLINNTFHQLKINRTPDIIQSAAILFKNCCELSRGKNIEMIRLKPESLALLAEILEMCKNYVLEIEEILSLINNELCPIIIMNLNEDIDEITGSKYIKCGLIICEITNGNQDIIKSIIDVLKNRKIAEWLSISCLDFISHILNNPEILMFIYKDSDLNLKLLDTLSKISHELFAQPEDLRQPGIKTRVRIISEIISHWVDSIAIIAEGNGIKLGEPNQSSANSMPEALVTSL